MSVIADDGDRAIAASLFRRQLVITTAAGALLVASVAVFLWAAAGLQAGHAVVRPIYYAGRDPIFAAHLQPHPSSHRFVLAAAAGAATVAALLALAVTHVVRVANFTFRKGDR